jgi:hypothetical protein
MNTLEQQLAPKVNVAAPPSPNRFFETMLAYQRTAALKAAIELDLFTAIGQTSGTIPELMARLRVPALAAFRPATVLRFRWAGCRADCGVPALVRSRRFRPEQYGCS